MTMQERDELCQELVELNLWGVVHLSTIPNSTVQRISFDEWYWSDIGNTFYKPLDN